MKILLIAGHGDGDPGAVANGYKEADLTRDAVTLLQKKLSKVADITVFDFNKNMYKYLRAGNTYPFKNFDYVIEVHLNSHTNIDSKGSEILVHTTEKGVSVETKILENIQALGFYNRGVIRRDNLLVMNTVKKYGVSHALIELCFLSNKSDIQRYISNKSKVIDAIVDGIIAGFGLEKAELTSANDLIWELSQTIQIDDVDGAVAALKKAKKENSPLYWLLYKVVNK